jgi:DNA-binding Lrp family transcriptional regulator
MDTTDIALLKELERGLPLVPAPFAAIGKRLSLPEHEVMDRIRHLKDAGIIRKFRARIDQQKVGITANALVAWKPSGNREGDPGDQLAAYPCATHCYERQPVPGRWEYTHYTVHHGYSRAEVLDEVREIAGEVGCPEYQVLFSTREYKRVPNVRMQENGGGSP